jgi:hypothetical protein
LKQSSDDKILSTNTCVSTYLVSCLGSSVAVASIWQHDHWQLMEALLMEALLLVSVGSKYA